MLSPDHIVRVKYYLSLFFFKRLILSDWLCFLSLKALETMLKIIHSLLPSFIQQLFRECLVLGMFWALWIPQGYMARDRTLALRELMF